MKSVKYRLCRRGAKSQTKEDSVSINESTDKLSRGKSAQLSTPSMRDTHIEAN